MAKYVLGVMKHGCGSYSIISSARACR